MRKALIVLAILLLVIPFAVPRELSRGSVEVIPEGRTTEAQTSRETQAPVERQVLTSDANTRLVFQDQAARARPAPSIPSVPGAELTQSHYGELLKAEMASYIRALACPEPASQVVTLPKMPVPEGSADCALIGKSAEIEAYLKSLEAAAAKCNARREASYKNALAAKQKLDNQIDQLWPSPPNLPKSVKSPPICNEPEPLGTGTIPSGMVPDEQYYASQLERMGEDVKEYCEIIDTKFISGIANACKSMNKEIPCIMDYYMGVKDTDKTAFHAGLNSQLNALNILYTYTDFFYKKTIVEYGIGSFRMYYNESNLDCGKLDANTLSIERNLPDVQSVQAPAVIQAPVEKPAYLSCKSPAEMNIQLPNPPYDASKDDCSLAGKGAEVDKYLAQLESIAKECEAKRENAWKLAQSEKKILDAQFGNLNTLPDMAGKNMKTLQQETCMVDKDIKQSKAKTADISSILLDESGKKDKINWLQAIEGKVSKYCEMVANIQERLTSACNLINDKIKCDTGVPSFQAGVYVYQLAILQKSLDAQFALSGNDYSATAHEYITGLQKYMADFKNSFNLSSLACLQPNAGSPTGAVVFTRMRGSRMYVKAVNSSRGFAGPCSAYREGNRTKYSCVTKALSRGSAFPGIAGNPRVTISPFRGYIYNANAQITQ